MAKTLNLNRFRKQRARKEKTRAAAASSARSGLSRAERTRLAKEAELRERRHSGLRRETPQGQDDP